MAMTTNEERREVTERLRRYLSYAKKHDADEDTDPCIHGNAMFRNIAQAVGGDISNITDTYEETLIKLIDIIEPEPERTCTIDDIYFPNSETDWGKCSNCSKVFPYQNDVVACPKCGAKVVDE